MSDFDFNAAADVCERAYRIVDHLQKQSAITVSEYASQKADIFFGHFTINGAYVQELIDDCYRHRPTIGIACERAGCDVVADALEHARDMIDYICDSDSQDSDIDALKAFLRKDWRTGCRRIANAAHALNHEQGGERISDELQAIREQLTLQQRALFDWMIKQPSEGRFDDMLRVPNAWTCPHTISIDGIDAKLKDVREVLPKAEWNFEISKAGGFFKWTKKPEKVQKVP